VPLLGAVIAGAGGTDSIACNITCKSDAELQSTFPAVVWAWLKLKQMSDVRLKTMMQFREAVFLAPMVFIIIIYIPNPPCFCLTIFLSKGKHNLKLFHDMCIVHFIRQGAM